MYMAPKHSEKESTASSLGGPYAVKDMLRQKPKILKTLMNAGFHVWSLDADSVVLDDFIERTLKFTAEPIKADVMLGLNEPHRLETAANVGKRVPKLNMGIMYLRNTLGSRHFLENIQKRLDENSGLVDQDAMEKVVLDESLVTITGLGLSKDDLYPSMNMGGSSVIEKGPLSAKGTHLQEDINKHEGDIGSVAQLAHPESQGPSTPKDSFSKYNLGKLFSLGGSQETLDYGSKKGQSKDLSALLLPDSAVTRIHLLDQLEFLNGALLKESRPSRSGPKILHIGKGLDQEKVLRAKGYWFIDTQGRCIDRPAQKKDVGPKDLVEAKPETAED